MYSKCRQWEGKFDLFCKCTEKGIAFCTRTCRIMEQACNSLKNYYMLLFKEKVHVFECLKNILHVIVQKTVIEVHLNHGKLHFVNH